MNKTHGFSKPGHLIMLMFFLMILPSGGYALDVLSGNNVTIEAGDVVNDDLYLFGEEVRIDGHIRGDLTIFARYVEIGGVVDGDLMVAAQVITITGGIGDDIRMAGQVLTLRESARAGDDIIGFGYSFLMGKGVNVGGDIIFYGYQLKVDGRVNGNLTGAMDRFELNGAIDGNVDVEVGSKDASSGTQVWMMGPGVDIPDVLPGLTVGSGAVVSERLHYRSVSEAEIASTAEIGELSFEKERRIIESDKDDVPGMHETEKRYPSINWGELIGEAFKKVISLFIVGVILVWLVPGIRYRWSEAIQRETLASFGWGLIALVGLWVSMAVILLLGIVLAVFFLVIKLGGLAKLAFALGVVGDIGVIAGYFIWARYIAYVITAFWIGNLIFDRSKPPAEKGRILPLAAGILIVVALTSIPYVGTLAHFLLVIFSLGSVILLYRGSRNGKAEESAVEPVPGEEITESEGR